MIKNNERLIVVLGMHRSGTSVITRGLKVMGVDLGDKLMSPLLGVNEKGFWEDLDVVALNTEMLNSLKIDWHFLAPIQPRDVASLIENGYLLQAIKMLKQKTANNSQLYGFKDPRTTKLLPFWKEVFNQGQWDVNYVITLRHPLSVCQSLSQRDGFEMEKGALLWLSHVISSFSNTVGENRILVNYDYLLQFPETELVRVAKNLQLQVNFSELQQFISDFLDKELRHTVYHIDDLLAKDAIPPLVTEIYTEAISGMDDKALNTRLDSKIAVWNKEYSRQISSLILADKLTAEIVSTKQALAKNTQMLHEAYNSKAWKLVRTLWKIRCWFIPVNSSRERFLRLLFRYIKNVYHKT